MELNAKHFDGLNARQREAVEHRDGPLLVVAGAGTGKTRVITHRIAHLIANGVRPEQILAVTFTNKAAAEMRERVVKLIQTEHVPFVGTFHSLGVHILRESGMAVGVSRWFAILDRDDSVAIIRKCLKKEGYDPKQFAPGAVLSVISKSKGNLINREDFEKDNVHSYFGEIVARVWRAYEKELAAQKALDFDDLLVKTVELLSNFEQVRKRYQSQWKYVHIDEYQDTNKVQYEMIRLLAGSPPAGGNVCVVGDADQTIYTWRGATIENIMGFEEDFPGAKVVILEENYRSTENILEAANRIIEKNDNRKEKNLYTKSKRGETIVLYEAFDPADEARFVVNKIRNLLPRGEPSVDKGGLKYEDVAILYRANFQSRVLEEEFLQAGLPYTVLGTRFYERAEVRDVLAYVKAALNPSDKVSFSRAAGTPRRGLGDKTLENYFKNGETGDKVRAFLALLESLRALLLSQPLPQALRQIMRLSGYEKMLKDAEEQERLENIEELINLSSKYQSLPTEEALEKFLTDAGLASDQDALLRENDKKRGVRLMTVHAAKGLEFEHVFIVGLEQDLFPHRPMDDDWSRERQEEERRLFYVALTRAKERLYLSHAQMRSVYGESRVTMPSEFLSDIPADLFEQVETPEPATGSPLERPGRFRGYLPDIIDLE